MIIAVMDCAVRIVTSVNIVGGSQPVCLGEKYEKTTAKACHEVSQSDGKCLDSTVYKELQKHYRNLWTRSEKEMPGILPKAAGSRDKTGKSDVHNLLERLRKYESTVLLFARNPQLAFTNNRSERNCMAKGKQKVSGYFRSGLYTQTCCRIIGYLQTMANKVINPINPIPAIQMALAGQAVEGSE